MIEVSQLRRDADTLLDKGETLAALRLLVAVLKRVPQDYTARLALADALARSGHQSEAATVYAAAARFCLDGGLPLTAIVAIRAIEALEVTELAPAVEALVGRAAEMYHRDSERVGAVGARLNVSYPEGVSVPAKELRAELTVQQLVADAQQVGGTVGEVGPMPPRFQRVPLLGRLTAERFAKVIRSLWVHRLPAGHVLMRRGERGTSCYLVASGKLRVSAPDDLGEEQELAMLGMGTLVGEMALITGSPRLATVTVVENADVLELGPDALKAMGEELGQLAPALEQMAQNRWMENLLAQSPLFRVFEGEERQAILKRCSAYQVPKGAALFEQGGEVKGIYLLMRGEVSVRRTGGDDGRVVFETTLPAGSTLGVYENLTNEPADATAETLSASTVLFLSRDSVQRLFKGVPAFKAHLKQIARARIEKIQAAEIDAAVAAAVERDEEDQDTIADVTDDLEDDTTIM